MGRANFSNIFMIIHEFLSLIFSGIFYDNSPIFITLNRILRFLQYFDNTGDGVKYVRKNTRGWNTWEIRGCGISPEFSHLVCRSRSNGFLEILEDKEKIILKIDSRLNLRWVALMPASTLNFETTLKSSYRAYLWVI